MKNIFLFLFLMFSAVLSGQSKAYFSSGAEMIFSLADIKDHGSEENSTLRWAPVINLQSMINRDLSNKFGLFSGIALRNVGYIYEHYKNDPAFDKKKFRSYNLGVPIGIKVGDMNKLFVYGGYEAELAIRYKEKQFSGGDKMNTITGWFSDRQNIFQHGFLVGIQFPYGLNLKFKYYLSEFHNQNFIESNGLKPYEGLNSHVFFFSLSTYLFRNLEFEPGTSSF